MQSTKMKMNSTATAILQVKNQQLEETYKKRKLWTTCKSKSTLRTQAIPIPKKSQHLKMSSRSVIILSCWTFSFPSLNPASRQTKMLIELSLILILHYRDQWADKLQELQSLCLDLLTAHQSLQQDQPKPKSFYQFHVATFSISFERCCKSIASRYWSTYWSPLREGSLTN